MKKIALLSLCLLLLSGCMASPVVVSVNGDKIDASEYGFYFNYQLMSVEKPEELKKDELENLKKSALDQAIANTLILQKCEEYKLEITKEEEEQIKSLKEDFIKELGGAAKYLEFLKQSAMNDRIYTKTQKNSYYQNKLLAYLTENLDIKESIGFTDEKLRQYFSKNYVKVKYILINAMAEDGTRLQGEQYENAEKFAKIVADGSREPEKDFDLLIEKYNDDEKMRVQPEGFVYSLLNLEKDPIFNKTLELSDNEIGGPYAVDNGFYIIKRIPVDAGYFDAHHEEILNSAIDMRYMALSDSWRSSANIKVSDVYEKIDQNNYKSYIK